eukprot:tig00000451_g974.t1
MQRPRVPVLLVLALAVASWPAALGQIIPFSPAPNVTRVLGSADGSLPVDQPGVGTATRSTNVYAARFCWLDRSLYYVNHWESALRKLTTHPEHRMSLLADLRPVYSLHQAEAIDLDDQCTACAPAGAGPIPPPRPAPPRPVPPRPVPYILMAGGHVLKVPRGGSPQVLVDLTGVCTSFGGGIALDTRRQQLWVLCSSGILRVTISTGANQLVYSGSTMTSSGIFYDRAADRMWLANGWAMYIQYFEDLGAPSPVLSPFVCGPGAKGWADGPCLTAMVNTPRSGQIVRWPGGGWYFWAEYSNHVVRGMNLATNEVVTVAGCGTATDSEGVGTSACISYPLGVAWDSSKGHLYVTTESGIYRIGTGRALRPYSAVEMKGGALSVTGGGAFVVA